MNKLFIKNMVCNRCIIIVQNICSELNLPITTIKLGEVDLSKELNAEERVKLNDLLVNVGFELITDKKKQIIENIKTIIIETVQNLDLNSKVNLSEILSSQLALEYNYLSNIFSEIELTTIEKYYIAQKIEKVKELLVYNELSLSEIAFKLNYSSVAYLSNQFKKVTGLSPSQFKKIGVANRKSLDMI